MSEEGKPRLVVLERELTRLISPPGDDRESSPPPQVGIPAPGGTPRSGEVSPPAGIEILGEGGVASSGEESPGAGKEDRLSEWKALAEENRPWRRGERGLLRLAISILESERWKRMTERVALPRGAWVVPKPRRIVLNSRIRRTRGRAGSTLIEISRKNYRDHKLGKKSDCRATLVHELVHCALMDAGAPYDHGPLFDRCFDFLMGSWKGPGAARFWKHVCACGAWRKERTRRESWTCTYCWRINVSPAEFKRILRIAAIGSKVIVVKPERYVMFRAVEKVE